MQSLPLPPALKMKAFLNGLRPMGRQEMNNKLHAR